MLANGIELGYKESSGNTYTNLTGLKEVPELGADPEKVENTPLSAKNKMYEFGIGDPGDLAYKFIYSNGVDSSYRKLRELADAGKAVSFEQKLPDGTKFQFDAMCSVKLGGGGVNAALEFTLNLALQSEEITIVDPA